MKQANYALLLVKFHDFLYYIIFINIEMFDLREDGIFSVIFFRTNTIAT